MGRSDFKAVWTMDRRVGGGAARMVGGVAAMLLPAALAWAQPQPPGPRVGDTYELSLVRESSQRGDDGSPGSSHDRDTITERVIAVRTDGLELEYDLPKAATAQDRAGSWQFPLRVFKPPSGSPQLLNRAELEGRVDAWLKSAGLTRAMCGRWIFTWNAFRIQCDPQAAVDALHAFDPSTPDLRDGALYQDDAARRPAPLVRTAAGPDGATFTVQLDVDPDAVRRQQAEVDAANAEITQKDPRFDAAFRAREMEAVAGTISVRLEADAAGVAWRRTKVTNLQIRRRDGHAETRTATETVERRLVSGPRGKAGRSVADRR